MILLTTMIVAMLYGALRFVFWEPSNITPGSFAYYTKVPSAVRSFPIWNNKNPPIFSIRISDGLKPHIATINYTSTQEISALQKKLEQTGAKCQVTVEKSLFCSSAQDNLPLIETVLSETAERNTHVDINFIGY